MKVITQREFRDNSAAGMDAMAAGEVKSSDDVVLPTPPGNGESRWR